MIGKYCSNNTNKLSPQEPEMKYRFLPTVQIIQINLVLKNGFWYDLEEIIVQIIQINLVLKNLCFRPLCALKVQIIQINLVLKNQ